MRRLGLGLCVLALAVMAFSASAVPITNSLGGYNWASYGGNISQSEYRADLVTLLNPAFRTGVGYGDLDPTSVPTAGLDQTFPGGGRQNYDAEAFFYTYTGDVSGGYLDVALVTGFNPYGEDSGISNPSTFSAGDLFIDLGNDGTYDIAVAMSLGEAGRSGYAWANPGNVWQEDPVYYDGTPGPDNNQYAFPYRVDESTAPVEIMPGGIVSTNHVQLDSNGNPGNERWLYEVRIALDPVNFDLNGLLGATQSGSGGIGLHWTMECGNDVIDVSDATPFAPIPEPATVVLFGMGVMGIALRARRPQC